MPCVFLSVCLWWHINISRILFDEVIAASTFVQLVFKCLTLRVRVCLDTYSLAFVDQPVIATLLNSINEGVFIFRFSSAIVCVFFSSLFLNAERRSWKKNRTGRIPYAKRRNRTRISSSFSDSDRMMDMADIIEFRTTWNNELFLKNKAACLTAKRLIRKSLVIGRNLSWRIYENVHTRSLPLVQARLCRHLKLTETDLTLQLRAAQQDRQLLSSYSRPHSLSENLQQVRQSTCPTFMLLQR